MCLACSLHFQGNGSPHSFFTFFCLVLVFKSPSPPAIVAIVDYPPPCYGGNGCVLGGSCLGFEWQRANPSGVLLMALHFVSSFFLSNVLWGVELSND